MTPMISACMIVKNEQRLLRRCLDSFAAAFDELCVVDTGSTDRTVAVAARFGAKLRHLSACNGPDGRIRDFALARNAALEMATGPWILWMDADDVLRPGAGQLLRAHAARGGFDGLSVTLHWNTDSWLQVRLLRNDPRHRFVGRVHEYIPVAGSVAIDRTIAIDHRPDKTNKEGSVERNLRILLDEAADDPTNARTLYYLANALRLAGRYDEAIARYGQYEALDVDFRCERYSAAHFNAVCYFNQQRWQEAIDAAWRALRIDPRYAETHCLIADCYGELRQYEFSRQWYASALACGAPPADAVLFVDADKYGAYPKLGLAVCDQKLGPATAAAR
jgi:glycosyltransferase involved in cell wall biosynthesis